MSIYVLFLLENRVTLGWPVHSAWPTWRLMPSLTARASAQPSRKSWKRCIEISWSGWGDRRWQKMTEGHSNAIAMRSTSLEDHRSSKVRMNKSDLSPRNVGSHYHTLVLDALGFSGWLFAICNKLLESSCCLLMLCLLAASAWEAGVIFCSINEAIKDRSQLVTNSGRADRIWCMRGTPRIGQEVPGIGCSNRGQLLCGFEQVRRLSHCRCRLMFAGTCCIAMVKVLRFVDFRNVTASHDCKRFPCLHVIFAYLCKLSASRCPCSAVFSDGSFCYIPKGTTCPMEISTYFRINNKEQQWDQCRLPSQV